MSAPTNQKNLRSELGRVKGLGAAHHGVGHWWAQRITALALIPLCLWFAYSLIIGMLSPNVMKAAEWFTSPINALAMALLIIAMFWHAKLGAQVIIEDYVHGTFAKYFLLLINSAFCILSVAVSILAILKLHFLDIGAAGGV